MNKSARTGNSFKLRALSTIAGIVFLSLLTAKNFIGYHKSSLHIDSSNQYFMMSHSNKEKKYCHAPQAGILFMRALEIPGTQSSGTYQKPFCTPLFMRCYIPARSPPVKLSARSKEMELTETKGEMTWISANFSFLSVC